MKYLFLLLLPIIYIAGWIIWYFRFGRPAGDSLKIISFHKISNTPELGGTFCYIKQFESFVKYLNERGFKSVSINEMISKKPVNGIVIFFDDAYESVYKTAYPILERYGMKASIAPITNYIGKENMWDGGLNRFKHMSDEQIKEMSDKGYDIVSHSASHKDMRKLKKEELIYECVESKRKLEEITNKRVDYFMYPYGLFNNRVKNAVKSAGYTSAFSSYALRNDAFDNFAIGRHSMYIIDTVFDLSIIINRAPLILFGHEDAKGRIINWFARFSGVIKV